MTRLIEQHIPMEMKYRPTVVYEANELSPNTVYIDANGRMGTSNLPEHLRHMTDPRQLDEHNPDPNAQSVRMINAALALDGPTRPTVIRKLNGQTTRVVFPDHERTSALPKQRRLIQQIRQVRQSNAPIQSASLADLNEAFEPGRSGLSDHVAHRLQARFQHNPHVVQGMAAVSRARKASEAIDPVTGIRLEAVHKMHPAMRQRLLDSKTQHQGARAPIIFHPKKTGYKTPNMAGYQGPTRPGLLPDVRLGSIGSEIPGTPPSYPVHNPRGSVFDKLAVQSAKGQGSEKLEEIIRNGHISASMQSDSMIDDAGAMKKAIDDRTDFVVSQAMQSQMSANGTVHHTLSNGAGETTAVGGKCGWKCWVLAALTAVGIGGGIYTLTKK